MNKERQEMMINNAIDLEDLQVPEWVEDEAEDAVEM